MKKIIALLGLGTTVFAQSNPNPNSTLNSEIITEMSYDNYVGLSTCMVKNNEIVWLEHFGKSDKANNILVSNQTVFLLASVSKVFTATAAMIAQEEGLLNIDLDINRYLPYNIEIPGHEGDSITCRDLLAHIASIIDSDAADFYDYPDPSISLADCIYSYFNPAGNKYSSSLNFATTAPGTIYEYSNMAYALLGYVVERASGVDFALFCETRLFEPLCMLNTHWHYSDFSQPELIAVPYNTQQVAYPQYGFADYPNGLLRSTVLDLANFTLMVLNNGNFKGEQIISSTNLEAMFTTQAPNLDPSQGLGWYTETLNGNSGYWAHNGGENGVTTDIYLNRSANYALIILANGEGDNTYTADAMNSYIGGFQNGIGASDCLNGISASLEDVFEIFPVPCSGHFNISSSKKLNITVLNNLGQFVCKTTVEADSSVCINHLKQGIYNCIISDDSSIVSKQIIVNR